MHHNIHTFKRAGAVLFALFAMSVSSSSQTLITSVPVFNVTHDDFGIVIGTDWSSIEVEFYSGFTYSQYSASAVDVSNYNEGEVVYFSELYSSATLQSNNLHRLTANHSTLPSEEFLFYTQPSDWTSNPNSSTKPVYALRLEEVNNNATINFADDQLGALTFTNGDATSGAEFSTAHVPSPMFSQSMNFIDDVNWSGNSSTGSGTSDRVIIPESNFEDATVGAFTIEMWFKPTDIKDEQWKTWLCSRENAGQFFGISMGGNTGDGKGELRFNFQGSTGPEYNIYTPADAIVENNWYHIVYTFGSYGNSLSLYINGALVQLSYYQGNTYQDQSTIIYLDNHPVDPTTTGDFWIGGNPAQSGRSADSYICGFKLYDSALTASNLRKSMGKNLNWASDAYNIDQPVFSTIYPDGVIYAEASVVKDFMSMANSGSSCTPSNQVTVTGSNASAVNTSHQWNDFNGKFQVSTFSIDEKGAYDITMNIADRDGYVTTKTLLYVLSRNSGLGEMVVTGSDQPTTIDGLVNLDEDLTLKGIFEIGEGGYMFATSGKTKLGTFDVGGTTYSSALKVPSTAKTYVNSSFNNSLLIDGNSEFFFDTAENYDSDYIGSGGSNDAEFALEISVADEGWHAFYSPFKRASGGEVMYYNGTAVTAETANLYSWNDDTNQGTYGWTSATLNDIQSEHDGGNQGFIGWFGTGGIGDGDTAPWTFELRGDDFATSTSSGTGSSVTNSQWFSSTNEAANSNWILLGNTRPGYISRTAMLGDIDVAFAPTLYVYDANSSGWTGLNGDDVLAPGQAFLVQADGNGQASYTQSADHMTSTLVAFRDEPCSIGLVATGAGINPDATNLVPNNEATIDFDPAFDVFHMGYGNAANLFTARNGVHFDKNCLPWSEGATHQEELHFHSPHPGTYTLSVIDSAMCWTGQRIEIENLETGEFHNLSNQPYAFDYDTVDEELVWTLHINRLGNLADEAFGSELDTDAAVSVESTDNEAAALTVVAQDGALQFAIAGDAAHVNWAGQIHDNSGRLVSEFQSQGRSNWSMPLNAQLTAGVYNINLRAAGQSALRATIYIH